MPFRTDNGTMSAQDVTLARRIFDDLCVSLNVGPEMTRRRDEIAHQVMLHLHAGDRVPESVSGKVMASLRKAG